MSLSRLGITERPLPYAEYRAEALNADILLWRPTSVWGRFIAAGTQGPWCHAAAAVWWGHRSRLMSVQYREGVGGYTVPTRTEITEFPGRCDVFRVPNLTDGQRADIAETMVSKLGGKYAWTNIRAIALSYLPGLRWLHNTDRVGGWLGRQASRSTSMICSQYVARCYRDHDVLFVRRRSGFTTPNDIGFSPAAEYVGTLV